MFHFLKSLFSSKEFEEKRTIEARYFEKYKDILNWEEIRNLLDKYKSSDIVYEPTRRKLTPETINKLFEQIDQSSFLSPQEKAETMIGLMMVLDGSFPERPLILRLEGVFGKEFVDTIDRKREEFKSDIAVKS